MIAETRELIEVFMKNLAICKSVQATTSRLQKRMARNNSAMRPRAARQTARRLRLLISARIDEHRLPDTVSRTARVSGFGGQCEACDGYLPTTELLMAIPNVETFVYLHAECWSIWRAQCRLRAAARR